jgi:hypothetical protein
VIGGSPCWSMARTFRTLSNTEAEALRPYRLRA